MSPRGRWYLKLRDSTCWPSAARAEPTVSPSNAGTVLPSKVNAIGRSRFRRSPGLGEAAHPFGWPTHSTWLVVVSRSAWNQARQPER